MGLLSLTLPTIGQPNSTEDANVRDSLSAIQTEFNGNVDITNLSSTAQQSLVPTGTILAFGGSSAPSGYLLCDGTAVTRGSYAALFAVIAESYGAGDGSTTFNVPDLRGRVAVGADGAAGRLSADDAVGESGGAETHTLTTAEMPSHTHTIIPSSVIFVDDQGSAVGDFGIPINTAAGVTGSAGGDGAHNNMPPYQVVNHIIKT